MACESKFIQNETASLLKKSLSLKSSIKHKRQAILA